MAEEKQGNAEGQKLNTQVDELKKEEEQSDELGGKGQKENEGGSRAEQDEGVESGDPENEVPSKSIR